MPVKKSSFDLAGLLACARGELFGPGNAQLPLPPMLMFDRITSITEIIGMEGDGPIMGTPRHAGVLVIGTNLPAVDATCTRLMDMNPWRISYLAAASGRLGPIAERHIEQRGESIKDMAQRFQLLDHPAFAVLRT